MKKIILPIVFFLLNVAIQAQQNDYFGSVIIPKNEYIVRLAGTNYIWTIKKGTDVIAISETNEQASSKLMFIPAGNGFYHIKFLQNGNYLQIDQESGLKTSAPERNDLQKFKVVSKGNQQYKFISISNKAIECIGIETNNSTLKLTDDTGNSKQTFEIIEAGTKKKL